MPLLLGTTLLTPSLAAAQQAPRLVLDAADADRDGHISEAERAAKLAGATAEITPVAEPTGQRLRPAAEPLGPGPLDMARRIVPPSEFETALEDRFNREVQRRLHD
jgi:hypothetical protein